MNLAYIAGFCIFFQFLYLTALIYEITAHRTTEKVSKTIRDVLSYTLTQELGPEQARVIWDKAMNMAEDVFRGKISLTR